MSYVSDALRRQVRERAKVHCEYCLLHEQYTLKIHEVDHVPAEKHGGTTTLDNLCLSCFDCNRHKGSDLSSVDPVTDEVVPLFHPRRDLWSEHFCVLDNGVIDGVTAKGRVTVRLLDFNHTERVTVRVALMRLQRYPSHNQG